MRACVTRVSEARVTVGGETLGEISRGLLVLLGVGPADTAETACRLAEKILRLRIFSDAEGKMNLDLAAVDGAILVVSQFTLYADTRSRRPGFSHSAPPKLAEELYEVFLRHCAALGRPPQHGRFGAEMAVSSVNDGPVTLWLDTDRP